jgi:hypothetical protein
MDNKNSPKTRQKFFCQICDYSCSKKSDYIKHLQTIKHLDKMDNKKLAKTRQTIVPSEYVCHCGKKYKYQSGLCKHKRYCMSSMNDNSIDTTGNTEQNNHSNTMQTQFIDLLRQNQEFKELIIDQNKTIMELSNRTNITNNTINNNQKFNLNFFLNTTCKDAMNMSEFIENINIDLQDIENIGKNGYVAGMTDVILSRIKNLEISKRPLHCTDLKRETMYIKDNDEWSKDTPENTKLKKMITIVAKQNYNTVPLWREKYPECEDWNNPKYDFCIDMMKNILGDVGDEQTRLDNKVIKNLSRHILVEK